MWLKVIAQTVGKANGETLGKRNGETVGKRNGCDVTEVGKQNGQDVTEVVTCLKWEDDVGRWTPLLLKAVTTHN